MEQVFAKFVLPDRLNDIAIGRRDQPDIHPQFLGAADARESAVLQKAQQLGLQRPAHVRNFIQENRSAVGLLDPARFLLQRAGERSRSPGFASPSAMARRISAATCSWSSSGSLRFTLTYVMMLVIVAS